MKKRVMDGNEAAAYISYAFTEVAAIYPITPSSPMAEKTDEWSAEGKKNIFDQTVNLAEMQSEAGAIGAIHGALETGTYATTYTSSQGLLLMIPVLHRIAGVRLPAVLHVASRTVGTHAMSIFGDHSDVMNCRQTGFAILSSANVQEVMDLGAVSHIAAINTSMPFIHFFDGFRTSHEIQKVDILNYEDLKLLINNEAVDEFKNKALNPEHPTLRNTVQNPDIYFQIREANNKYYDELPDKIEQYMKEINNLTGRDYSLFNYYGAEDAVNVIVAMGSVSGAIKETVETLCNSGEKVGFVQVHLYRPFSLTHFLNAIPASTKVISVLDRTKESGALGEPLYQDICSAYSNIVGAPAIVGGRYGLSSKDTTPQQIKAVFENMKSTKIKNNFTIGIVDDVSNLSLSDAVDFSVEDNGVYNCKFWGLGSDGTVGANKNTIKIIGRNTDKYVQAYFEYDTKKSFGITKSHLRISEKPIESSYLVKSADFIACHNRTYIEKYDIVSELKPGGILLLNCDCHSQEELDTILPSSVKKALVEKKATLFLIDANRISRQLGLGDRINIILQAAFFRISNIIPLSEAIGFLEESVKNTYKNKGSKVVNKNLEAINKGLTELKLILVPESWKHIKTEEKTSLDDSLPEFIEKLLIPINNLKGDDLPVSIFENYSDGTMPLGTSSYEKRGIATMLPVWDKDKCVQCNNCAFVCPHAVIRPFLLNDKELGEAPDGLLSVPANGKNAKKYNYSLIISDLDCTGCGSCAEVCPNKASALTMIPKEDKNTPGEVWEYGLSLSDKGDVFSVNTVKGSQFKQPLCEFSGACAGCGETPYAKLLTQLYGDKMYWANATGCSQAWGASMPSIPYTINKNGKGPAWSNSLFENNAEFGFGMLLSYQQQRNRLKEQVLNMQNSGVDGLNEKIQIWIETFDDLEMSAKASKDIIDTLEGIDRNFDPELYATAQKILNSKDYFSKKTVWMFGGDGWAYDIGYGGLDHVIATGENINVFVVDTEVYSNTGGQSSKATQLGAVAKFQSAGKATSKKNLGKQMMSYGNVYVASVAMGANPNQLLKAITEAESYNGPSVIIAYAPCVVHGIKAGMNKVQNEMKRAVNSGYWPLYRYDPRKEIPFQLDHNTQDLEYKEFLAGEVRYAALEISYPENANILFDKAEDEAINNLNELKTISKRSKDERY